MPTNENGKKAKRVKPELPSGFRDYAPAETIAKQQMLDTIRETFERFGFDPLETSSVQRTEVLTGGEEDSGKIIFNVKGSQEKISNTSLRFDLTVPLARFMSANPDLPKPFKRYQIGNVWRGERSQAGRYKEFLQADVDIVGTSSVDADVEIIAVLHTALTNLGVGNFIIGYNNRKILNVLPRFAAFPEERLWEMLRAIDKLDKIGRDGVLTIIEEEFGKDVAAKMGELPDFGVPMELRDEETNEEFRLIIEGLEALGIDTAMYVKAQPSLVRGLSYYTGMVLEVILPDVPEVGSVAGGGRYDNLVATFTGQSIPAVGVSLGVDRLFTALERLGKPDARETTATVLVLQIDPALRNECFKIARRLRDANINTALYLGDDRSFQAQLAYAVKKDIPYVMLYGAQEKETGNVTVKELTTRKQASVPEDVITSFEEYFK